MYKKTIKGLSQKDREDIESDLLKSTLSHHDIAKKHNVFDDVITDVAVSMGLISKDEAIKVRRNRDYSFKSGLGISTSPAPSTPSLTITPEDKESKPKKRKKVVNRKTRTENSPELTAAIVAELRSLEKDNWKYFNRKAICTKFNISSSTLSRRATEAKIELPKISRNGSLIFKDHIIAPATITIPEESMEMLASMKEELTEKADNIVIPIDTEDLIPLSQYVDTKVLCAKIDNTILINKITNFIFSKDVSKIKISEDIETPIKTFFEENIKDKKINILRVYFKPTDIDFRIASILTKYATEYQCNLTFYKGTTEFNMVSDYEKLNKNFQKICSTPTGTNKFLYKVEYENVANLETIYTVTVKFGAVTQLIVTDTYDKALLLSIRYEKKYEADHTVHTTKVSKINNGNEFTFFTIGQN